MERHSLWGHDLQREMFRRALQRGRLGHAYLFSGPRGIGKKQFALLLAQSLLCEKQSAEGMNPCGECSGCRQVLTLAHPDLMLVGLPEGKSELPIETFVGSPDKRGREGLCHDLSLAPMHGGFRVAIIDDADCMNIASANALLKTLEEPGPRSVLILITEDAEQVIRTIRSRCQQVNFGALADAELQAILKHNAAREGVEYPPERLAQALREAQGSVLRAEEWLTRMEQGGSGAASLSAVLSRPGFRVQDLASAADQLLNQYGSDTQGQRAGAHAILDCCREYCYRHLVRTATEPDVDPRIPDAWGDALELCLHAGIQNERRASVSLCLDAFYQELEIRLRPTWKNMSVRS